uniref:EGF-like domain-containing protein n=1 Tax=Seriola lalandi dorsalis TaxID=1841481 RepID=A0A3B4Y2A1_SERLL
TQMGYETWILLGLPWISLSKSAPCHPNPCRNGGLCEESPTGFVCHCPEGFGGLFCDSRVDFDCMSYSCQEEQICNAGERVRT